jgi:hypothetical protein
LNGQYPAGAIDWGSGQWFHSGPWKAFTTKSVSFARLGLTTASVTVLNGRKLLRLEAMNGGSATTTVTLSCPGQATRSVNVPPGAPTTITTNWSGPCSTVTISSSNGWDTNFDNLALE